MTDNEVTPEEAVYTACAYLDDAIEDVGIIEAQLLIEDAQAVLRTLPTRITGLERKFSTAKAYLLEIAGGEDYHSVGCRALYCLPRDCDCDAGLARECLALLEGEE